MLEKKEEEFSDDEKKLAEEFYIKVKFLEEEREKYRKVSLTCISASGWG